jgi:murein DD-endopeptidase MepM/ murein hydrolase activator NlpD
MGTGSGTRCGWPAVAATAAFAALVAGCSQAPAPAPVVVAPQLRQITIERGQTLSGIAYTYHVAMSELAEVNHLAPPYRILAGGTLLIPMARATPPEEATPTATAGPAPPVAIAALPPPTVATVTPTPPRTPPPTSAASELPAPATLAPPRPPSESSASGTLAPPSRAVGSAELTPPERVAPPQSPAPSSLAQEPAGFVAHPKPATLPAAIATATPPARGNGAFVWPVRGHIVEAFGSGPDGTHNDGINIAAPRGSPVQAVDGGVVAYAGNELRGYGNLILIKHPEGWISAYAHCDLILVKRGQKVARGQVIARVGSTGNVNSPQLHFELRHGDKPVDPRAYLAPLPAAAATQANSG